MLLLGRPLPILLSDHKPPLPWSRKALCCLSRRLCWCRAWSPAPALQAGLSLEPIQSSLSSKDEVNFCLFSPLLLDPKKNPKAKKCCLIKWFSASLTWKGVGFGNEHPCFSHPDERTVKLIVTAPPTWSVSQRRQPYLSRHDGKAQPPPPETSQSDGKTQPHSLGRPCLMGKPRFLQGTPCQL